MSEQLLAASGLKQRYIQAGKWRRYPGAGGWRNLVDIKTHLLNLRDLFKLVIGFWQSLFILMRLRPRVVFVKGGYVGLPVGLAAWVLGLPLIIHESDIVAGLSNRILARLAKTIATGWPTHYYPQWRGKHLVFTGNPIRSELLATTTTPGRGQRSRLLVIGGSSGARAINRAIVSHLEVLSKDFDLTHVAGRRDYTSTATTKPIGESVKKNYHLVEFLDTGALATAYRRADIIISRAGMNTLAEVAAIGKPLIVVPHPTTPGDHQRANARALEHEQAALVIEQSQLADKLVPTLRELSASTQHQQLLVKGLKRLAKPEAAKLLAKEVLRLA